MLDLVVTDTIPLNEQYVLLKFTYPKPLPEMQPGQFVELKVDNSATTFLRRPISVHYIDLATNELWLLIQTIGDGTRKMATYAAGEVVNMLLPLGNSFSMPNRDQNKLLLIGGGVGVAPLLFMGANLKKQGYAPIFLLGARTSNDLLETEEFQKYGQVYFTTEDGSLGEKGYVTQHSVLFSEKFDKIYTCGPTPMMKAVAAYAAKNQIDCEVSLENTMACGFGACLCCVTDTVEGHQCVCTEGPVFNTKQLKWQI